MERFAALTMSGGFPGRLLTAVAMPVTGLLSAAVVVGAFVWPPVMAVAGDARPAAAVVAAAPAPTKATEPKPTRRPEPSMPTRRATPTPPPASTPATTTVAPPVARTPSAQPRGSVRLPDGGTARLVRRDLEPGGVLPVPDDLGEATWWGAGITARSGATVLAGHVNWRGQVGPFAELWRSRIADRVTVVDGSGKRHAYRVTQVLTVPKEDLPGRAEQLFGQDGPHRMVLVTCGGRWIGGPDGYEENRIVIAERA